VGEGGGGPAGASGLVGLKYEKIQISGTKVLEICRPLVSLLLGKRLVERARSRAMLRAPRVVQLSQLLLAEMRVQGERAVLPPDSTTL
jgi:hypothetical protein